MIPGWAVQDFTGIGALVMPAWHGRAQGFGCQCSAGRVWPLSKSHELDIRSPAKSHSKVCLPGLGRSLSQSKRWLLRSSMLQ